MEGGEAVRGFIDEDFTEYLEEKYSPKTIVNTLTDLKRVNEFIEFSSRDDFRKWLREKRKAGMKNVTVNHYLRSINQYCDFKKWQKFDYLSESKVFRIKSVNDDEIGKISEFAGKGYTGARDSAIMALELGCGLRIGEIHSLQLRDIEGNVITVIGKNQKTRQVYLPDEVLTVLKRYLRDRISSDPNFVFTTPKGRISYEYIRQVIPRKARQAGVNYGNHAGRHTYAVKLLRSGMSIYDISKVLGHDNPKTTAIYLESDQSGPLERLKETVEGKKLKFFLRKKEFAEIDVPQEAHLQCREM